MEGSFGMITIDTHIIIWEALKPELLSKKAKESIQNIVMGNCDVDSKAKNRCKSTLY